MDDSDNNRRYLNILFTIISTAMGSTLLFLILIIFNTYFQPEYGVSIETSEIYIESLEPLISLFNHINEEHFRSNAIGSLIGGIMICMVIRVRYYIILLSLLIVSGVIFNINHPVYGISTVVFGMFGFITVLYSVITFKIAQFKYSSNINITELLVKSVSDLRFKNHVLDKADSVITSAFILCFVFILYIMNKQAFADLIIAYTSATIENPEIARLFIDFDSLSVHYTNLSSKAHAFGYTIGSFFGFCILIYKYYVLKL